MNELIEQIVSEWVIEKRVNVKSRRAAKVALRKDWEGLASLLDQLSLLTPRALDETTLCPECGVEQIVTHLPTCAHYVPSRQ